MANLRSVNTKFWEDSWVEELHVHHKLLFLYLITNGNANLAGVYEITIKRICFETGLEKESVKKGLEYFQKVGKVYYIDSFIFLPNWLKNQKMNQNMKIGVMKIFMELPKNIQDAIFGDLSDSIFNHSQTISNGYQILSNALLKYEVEDEKEKEIQKELFVDKPLISDNENRNPIIKQTPKQTIKSKDSTTVKDIMDYFSFNEMNHFRQLSDITAFVNILESENQLDFFKSQFAAYQKFKRISKQKPQFYDTFINGGWSKMNWETELKNIENEQTESIPEDPNAELKRKLRGGKVTATGN